MRLTTLPLLSTRPADTPFEREARHSSTVIPAQAGIQTPPHRRSRAGGNPDTPVATVPSPSGRGLG